MPESDSPLYRGASPLETSIGLFAGTSFRLATGRCLDCAAIPHALWYFADETIAAPCPDVPVAGFTRGINAWQDVERWTATHPPGTPIDAPPLIWIGSSEIVRGASLSADGRTLAAGAKRWSFAVVPKIPLNRSYYNAASTAYLAPRSLTVRGSSHDGVFTARTLWPEDFRLDSSAPLQRVDPTPEGRWCEPNRAAARRARSRRQRCGSAFPGRHAAGRARPFSPSSSTARKAMTTKRTAVTSPSSRAAWAPRARRVGRARSTIGSPTISTRSMQKAKRASSRRCCRSTIISPI